MLQWPKKETLEAEEAHFYDYWLGLVGKSSMNNIPVSLINDSWDHLASSFLVMYLIQNLLGGQDKQTVPYIRLRKFYRSLAHGTNEDKAVMIVDIIQSMKDQGITGSPRKRLIQLVQAIIRSYIKIHFGYKELRCQRWYAYETSHIQEDSYALAKYMIRHVETYDDVVTVGAVEAWLYRAWIFPDILKTVIKVMSHTVTETQFRTLLPYPNTTLVMSTMMDYAQVLFLNALIPPEHQTYWELIFSTFQQGFSWSSFQQSVVGRGPTLLLIQDQDSNVFGGYASTRWKYDTEFYGDDQCFLFTLRPQFQEFKATGVNRNFQYFNNLQGGGPLAPVGLGMGGQVNEWGFFLYPSFGTGTVSAVCDTFQGYKAPCRYRGFKISRIEVWDVSKELDDDTFQKSQFNRFSFSSNALLL